MVHPIKQVHYYKNPPHTPDMMHFFGHQTPKCTNFHFFEHKNPPMQREKNVFLPRKIKKVVNTFFNLPQINKLHHTHQTQ
jgi:hypothetical protein